MRERISIISMASVSALGLSVNKSWEHYIEKRSFIKERDFEKFTALVSSISTEHWAEINQLKKVVKLLFYWGIGLALAFTLIYFVGINFILKLLT